MSDYEAWIETIDKLRRTVTLHIARWIPHEDKDELLMTDGTWLQVPTHEFLAQPSGLVLPLKAWEAVVKFAAPHADEGEVKALREALAIERARVDTILGQR